jgi:hypothetical protein
MKHSGTIPRGPLEVADLAPLFERSGPVATVYLATPPAIENAAMRDQLRWSDARRELVARGAPRSVVQSIDSVVPDAHLHGSALAVIADTSGVLHVEHSAIPTGQELVRWDELPSVTQMIEWRQHQLPYLAAVIDHQGADLFAGSDRTGVVEEETGGAGRYPIARNAPGGWSQRRYQQHALENWAHNARQAAEATVRLADRVDPDIVLVGGDPHARELFLDELPPALRGLAKFIPASRGADGDGAHSAREISRLLETTSAAETVQVLEEFRQQLGRNERAVQGVEATMDALRQSQVAVLLIHDDPDDRRRAWFGLEATAAATRREELVGVGSGKNKQGRLVDVALRVALGTGAEVRVVPRHGGPPDGLGALLRWS